MPCPVSLSVDIAQGRQGRRRESRAGGETPNPVPAVHARGPADPCGSPNPLPGTGSRRVRFRAKTAAARRLHDKHVIGLHSGFVVPLQSLDCAVAPKNGVFAGQSGPAAAWRRNGTVSRCDDRTVTVIGSRNRSLRTMPSPPLNSPDSARTCTDREFVQANREAALPALRGRSSGCSSCDCARRSRRQSHFRLRYRRRSSRSSGTSSVP